MRAISQAFVAPSRLWCMHAKSLQSCLCNTMDCSLPGSSVHGILQARIPEWVAVPSSRKSSQPRDGTHFSLCLLHWQAGSLPLAWYTATMLSVIGLRLTEVKKKFFKWSHCSLKQRETKSKYMPDIGKKEVNMYWAYVILQGALTCLLIPLVIPSCACVYAKSLVVFNFLWPYRL